VEIRDLTFAEVFQFGGHCLVVRFCAEGTVGATLRKVVGRLGEQQTTFTRTVNDQSVVGHAAGSHAGQQVDAVLGRFDLRQQAVFFFDFQGGTEDLLEVLMVQLDAGEVTVTGELFRVFGFVRLQDHVIGKVLLAGGTVLAVRLEGERNVLLTEHGVGNHRSGGGIGTTHHVEAVDERTQFLDQVEVGRFTGQAGRSDHTETDVVTAFTGETGFQIGDRVQLGRSAVGGLLGTFEHFGDTEVFIDGQGDPLDLQTLDGAAGGDRLTSFIQAILTVVSTLIRRNFGLQDVHAQTQASGCRIFRNQTANERQVSSREHSTGQFRLVSTILGTAIKRVGAINGVCTTATNEQSIVGGAPLGKEREQRQVDRKTFFFQN